MSTEAQRLRNKRKRDKARDKRRMARVDIASMHIKFFVWSKSPEMKGRMVYDVPSGSVVPADCSPTEFKSRLQVCGLKFEPDGLLRRAAYWRDQNQFHWSLENGPSPCDPASLGDLVMQAFAAFEERFANSTHEFSDVDLTVEVIRQGTTRRKEWHATTVPEMLALAAEVVAAMDS